MGRCLFCRECAEACPEGAIAFSRDHRLAAARARGPGGAIADGRPRGTRGLELSRELLRLYGRSLKLRQVSAGGCNGCEADMNVLSTIVFDLGRFGIQFVASPRHADGLLITGPIPQNMQLALKKTDDAVPAPEDRDRGRGLRHLGRALPRPPRGAQRRRQRVVPVDLYVPGCPPHPFTILEALLGLLGRRTALLTRSEPAVRQVEALVAQREVGDLLSRSASARPLQLWKDGSTTL